MAFAGKWTVAKFEGLRDVAVDLGADEAKMDPAKLQGATVEITQDGDNLTFNATGGLGKSGTHSMTVGQPSEGELFGKAYSGTTAWDGDKIVSVGKSGVKLTRSIDGGQLLYTLESNGKTGKVWFSK